ncbi:MAG: TrmH family RNA methyltransferase [Bdellovibrionota bacterium]
MKKPSRGGGKNRGGAGRPSQTRSGAAPSGRSQAPRSGRPSPKSRAAEARGGGDDRRTNEVHPRRDGARWVVGIHSVEETLKIRPKAIREMWLKVDFESSQQLSALAASAQHFRIKIHTRSPGQLDQIGSGNQGVAIAVTENPELDWSKLEAEGSKVVLICDGLEDPQNLGAILRTAWLTGVDAIFIPEDRAVGLTPAVCKIASGGAEHVPVEVVSNLATEMKRLQDLGFWIYGLSEKGTRKPWEFKLPEKTAWVIGSEGSGMRITTERACDELVRIPQVASGSSYNASIAAAMALSETARQLGRPE